MKRLTTIAVLAFAAIGLMACEPPADVASRNLSKAADNFEIVRKITFYNTWQDMVMLEVTGRCSIGNYDSSGKLSITCKNGEGKFVKHFLGLSGQVTFVSEQIEVADVSTYHTRVLWRPQTLIPEVDVQVDVNEALRNRH